jgi:dienelactone hydrolase
MNLREEALDVAVDGQHIAGTLLLPAEREDRTPGVLFVHGWGGNREQYLARARTVAALGCVCLTFDLRGHEATQSQHETVTREDSLHDVLAAYDVLARVSQVDAQRIALVGSSYGAYIGALASASRQVRWLALRAPAIYKDTDWDLPKRKLHQDPDFGSYRQRPHRAADNRALEACTRFHGDVLVVESEEDSIVPHPVIANYIAAFANARSLTYRVIEGADHGLTQGRCKEAYTDLLITWMKEMTASARGAPATQPQAVAAAAASLPEES